MIRRLLSSTNALYAAVLCLPGDFLLKSVARRRHFPRSTAFVIASRARTDSSRASSKYSTIHASKNILPLDRPPDPSSFSSTIEDKISGKSYVQQQAMLLRNWMRDKQSIVCITGAGLSTESGIPDYRGNNGSYFRGHKPIIHHEFMSSQTQRKRYWARSLVGYSPFANAQPNLGHEALAKLETMGYIGVELEDCTDFEHLGASCTGQLSFAYGDTSAVPRKISIITQNVDTLHSKAGVQHCLHLHGRGDLVRCMNCGFSRDRKDYHEELMKWNHDWLNENAPGANVGASSTGERKADLRPDGDAELSQRVSYDELILPSCSRCGETNEEAHSQRDLQPFFKTDVVFFGDSVPKHRFGISNAAIDAADGVLCIGTSLAVHSAFRLAKRAIENDTPVAIINVGQTRVEKEGLDSRLVTKLESPIGETLNELVNMFGREES
jgi:NAD-dependent deacetylase sirtuin 4